MKLAWPASLVGLGAAAAAAAYLHAPAGRSYPLPLSEARQVLREVELPDGIYGSVPSASPALPMADGSLVWKLRIGSEEALRYTATLSADGADATRVAIALSAPTEGRHASRVAAALDDRPQVRQFYLKAMEEQVAAALEARPYRWETVMPAMGAAMAASVGEMTAQIDEIAARDRVRARAEIDRAYREEARGGGQFGEESDYVEGAYD